MAKDNTRNNNCRKHRVGMISYTKYGTIAELVDYIDAEHVCVKFENVENDYIYITSFSNFKTGQMSNPFDRTLYGVGYLGVGNINRDALTAWQRMFGRCYDANFIKREPTYNGCQVCEEWYNFQNFQNWYNENIYFVNDEKMQLDKDILQKGNKLYSSQTCIFVPKYINTLIIKNNAIRGEYPIGVYFNKSKGKFVARCKVLIDKKQKTMFLGYYNNPTDAFSAYKRYKETYIKKVAEDYKQYIPKRLYDALLEYKVDITD